MNYGHCILNFDLLRLYVAGGTSPAFFFLVMLYFITPLPFKNVLRFQIWHSRFRGAFHLLASFQSVFLTNLIVHSVSKWPAPLSPWHLYQFIDNMLFSPYLHKQEFLTSSCKGFLKHLVGLADQPTKLNEVYRSSLH